jgi:PAS domain S-box-containing protein
MNKLFIKSHHLIIALAVVITIITGVVLILFNNSTEKEIVKESNAQQLYLVKELSREIETYLINRVQLIDVLSTLPVIQNQELKNIITEINQFHDYENKNYVKTISLYNEVGTIIYSTNSEIIGHKLGESEIFKWAQKPENRGKRYISSPIKLSGASGDSVPHLHFVIAAPVYKTIIKNDDSASAKFIGVITETLEFDKLLFFLTSNYQSNMVKNHFWLMDSSGNLLFHSDNPKMVFANINKVDKSCMGCHVSFKQFGKMFSLKSGNLTFQHINKQKILAGYNTLDLMNISWTLVLNLPADELTHFVKKNLLQSYLLFGLIALTFFSISYFIYRNYKQRVRSEAENEQLREKNALKEKIAESEEGYRNLVESSPDAIAVHTDGIIVYVNEAGVILMGASKTDDLIGKPILELVHPDYHESVKKRTKDVIINNEHTALSEERFIRLDGRIIDVDVIAIPINYNEKRSVQVIVRDITERRISEEALKESELKYRLLYDNNPHPMWVYDTDSLRFLTVNSAAINNYGYSKEEFLTMTIKDIHLAEDVPGLLDNFSKTKNEQQRVSNARHIRKNGSLIFVEVHSHSIKYEYKNARLVLAYDITDRLNAEAELLKLSRAVEQGPSSVVITNQEGDIEYVNQKFCQVTGFSKEEVIGKNPRMWKSGIHDKLFYENLWNTLLSGKNWNGEMMNRKKNGELFWQSILISPLINNDGDITHFVAVKEDITEKKNMISELIEAKEMAESANRLKDAFIANISHEIRTPLNGLLGMSGLIRDTFHGNMKKEDEELFIGIDFSSKRIIRTVDMILNYSRLQVGKFPVFRKNMDLIEVCENLIREYSKAAQQKSLDLVFRNNSSVAKIFADEYSITMAISNLIDNAIKFTQKGSVQIILSKRNDNNIELEVKDTGIGISEDYLDKIFEPYLQEQMGYGRAYDGVGLGLSLVKKVLSLNDAVISIKSEKGRGTSFIINFGKDVLSSEKLEETIKAPPITQARENLVVLIVEDDLLNQVTIKKFIGNKYDTIITDSSDEALDILKKKKVDLILMDISIKGQMNGLELTRELKASKEFSNIRIIAITAHAFEEDRQNALRAGCDDFLAKPFSKQSLLERIANIKQNSI